MSVACGLAGGLPVGFMLVRRQDGERNLPRRHRLRGDGGVPDPDSAEEKAFTAPAQMVESMLRLVCTPGALFIVLVTTPDQVASATRLRLASRPGSARSMPARKSSLASAGAIRCKASPICPIQVPYSSRRNARSARSRFGAIGHYPPVARAKLITGHGNDLLVNARLILHQECSNGTRALVPVS
jgi:hypothetical protein